MAIQLSVPPPTRFAPARYVPRIGGVSGTNSRLFWMLAVFAALSSTVLVRLVSMELKDGADYRAVAAEPIVRKHAMPAMRGRILARDGTVLACDEPIMSLAVNYRWLQEPPDPRWLRRTARSRLSAPERRDPQMVANTEQTIVDERRDLHVRLAALCGVNADQWRLRSQRIQRRVESMSDSVNARHQTQAAERQASDDRSAKDADRSLLSIAGRSIVDAFFATNRTPEAPPIVIAEEVSEHVVFDGLPVEAVAEIEANPARYPGVTLVKSFRRSYPQGDLAAHAVGYLGRVNAEELAAAPSDEPLDPEDWVGRSGLERQYEKVLRAQRGLTLDELDIRGNVHRSTRVREPGSGQDLVVTLDPRLQQAAESLIDQALARRLSGGDEKLDAAGGGAIVAIDVRSGTILAAAAAPRFDPNSFVMANSPEVAQWLRDSGRPLLDRTAQMALPPGSVFKIVSAAAILAAGIDPRAPVECQGYLHQPDALRCAVYRRYGIGHGPVTLIDALARSCNVFFFHHAEQLGEGPILDWARRFGLGAKTGIDLPSESAGQLPRENLGRQNSSAAARQARVDPLPLVIGQSTTTATPLQTVRIVAAIANGGRLVTPHFAERLALRSDEEESQSERIEKSKSLFDSLTLRLFSQPSVSGLNEQMISAIRSGLRQAVADEQGTAHATVDLAEVTIAGKTGTAETGRGKPEHAWFAGYAPAEEPRVAFVVVIEHAGNADTAAGPVARLLVARMVQLGYFGRAVR